MRPITPCPYRKLTRDGKTINALTDTVKKHPWYASALGVIALYALLGFLVAPYLLEKTLVETMQQDFVRTARAKGLSETAVVLRHALKGAILPVV